MFKVVPTRIYIEYREYASLRFNGSCGIYIAIGPGEEDIAHTLWIWGMLQPPNRIDKPNEFWSSLLLIIQPENVIERFLKMTSKCNSVYGDTRAVLQSISKDFHGVNRQFQSCKWCRNTTWLSSAHQEIFSLSTRQEWWQLNKHLHFHYLEVNYMLENDGCKPGSISLFVRSVKDESCIKMYRQYRRVFHLSIRHNFSTVNLNGVVHNTNSMNLGETGVSSDFRYGREPDPFRGYLDPGDKKSHGMIYCDNSRQSASFSLLVDPFSLYVWLVMLGGFTFGVMLSLILTKKLSVGEVLSRLAGIILQQGVPRCSRVELVLFVGMIFLSAQFDAAFCEEVLLPPPLRVFNDITALVLAGYKICSFGGFQISNSLFENKLIENANDIESKYIFATNVNNCPFEFEKLAMPTLGTTKETLTLRAIAATTTCHFVKEPFYSYKEYLYFKSAFRKAFVEELNLARQAGLISFWDKLPDHYDTSKYHKRVEEYKRNETHFHPVALGKDAIVFSSLFEYFIGIYAVASIIVFLVELAWYNRKSLWINLKLDWWKFKARVVKCKNFVRNFMIRVRFRRN